MGGARAAAAWTVQHRAPITLARARDPRSLPVRAAHRLRVAAPATRVPPRRTDRWFLRLSQVDLFKPRAYAPTMGDRERFGREASPPPCVMDAQAARSRGVGVAGERGYDPARRIIGRKRRALTDTASRLLVAGVSIADLHDNHGVSSYREPRAGSSPCSLTASQIAPTKASASTRPKPSWSKSLNRKPGRRASPFSPGSRRSSVHPVG